MFLRRTPGRDPLPVAMTGVRAGERLLQIGAGDPRIVGALAAKVGISGHAAAIVADDRTAARMVKGAEQAGALLEVHVRPLDALPFANASFDAVVVHAADGLLATLAGGVREAAVRECYRVLRPGGRLVTIEPGTPRGLGAWLRQAPAQHEQYEAAGGTIAWLKSAGFAAARVVGDREGYRFVEGLKT